MNVAIITGSFPPDVCGVGDYTNMIYKELTQLVNVKVIKFNICNLHGFRLILKKIKQFNPQIVHIQYPTEGYGYSLLPMLLAIWFKSKVVITLHEFSNKRFSGKLAIYLFLLFSRKIIFTTAKEFEYSIKYAPFIKKKAKVIGIGSNIPSAVSYSIKLWDVVFFGHFRPIGSMEQFIRLAEINRSKNGNLKFLIIGQKLDKYHSYFDVIRNRCEELQIEMKVSIAEEEVANCLARSKYAFLPYSDGISFRRGSFLAAYVNGCTIISTRTKNTEKIFEKIAILINSEEDAYEAIINDLHSSDEKFKDNLISSISWENISKEHFKTYQSIIKKTI